MDTPYVVAIVSLSDSSDVRLLGNMWDIDPADLEIGMPVTAQFSEVSPECTLVNWTPTEQD